MPIISYKNIIKIFKIKIERGVEIFIQEGWI